MRYLPRVTIRELIPIVVIVTPAAGWFVDHRRILARAEAQRAEAHRGELEVVDALYQSLVAAPPTPPTTSAPPPLTDDAPPGR